VLGDGLVTRVVGDGLVTWVVGEAAVARVVGDEVEGMPSGRAVAEIRAGATPAGQVRAEPAVIATGMP